MGAKQVVSAGAKVIPRTTGVGFRKAAHVGVHFRHGAPPMSERQPVGGKHLQCATQYFLPGGRGTATRRFDGDAECRKVSQRAVGANRNHAITIIIH